MQQIKRSKTIREPAEKLKPVIDPAGWSKDELAGSTEWIYNLSDAEISDLDHAVREIEAGKISLKDVRRDDFSLPILGPALDALQDELLNGRGFAVIRGVPVQRYTREQSAIAFWGVGRYFGDPASQNAKGHLIGHVKDLGGKSLQNPHDRGYHTAEMLPFHVDGVTDIVGLMCLQPSKSGGESAIVSSVSIYNEMLKRRPEFVAALSEPIYRDRRGEIPEGAKPYYPLPVFNYHQGYLATNYQGGGIRAARRFTELPPHSTELTQALEMFDELAHELCITMEFQQGDIQLLNNHVIVHSRISAIEDYPEESRKRHLLRLRMMTARGRPLSPAYFAQQNLPVDQIQPGQRPSGAILTPGAILKIPLEAE